MNKNLSLFLLPLLLAVCGVAHAQTLVGHSNNKVAATSNPLTFAVTAGDQVIITFESASNPTTVAIADTLGNTWTTVVSLTGANAGANGWLAVFYCQSANASGSDTITLTSGTSVTNWNILAEYSGVGAFDTVSTFNAHTNTSVATNSVTPSQSGDLAIAVVGTNNATSATFSAWTNSFVQEDSGTFPNFAWADQVLPTAAAVTTSATASTTIGWSAFMMLFKAASGSTCIHSAWLQNSTIVVPTAGSTVVARKDVSFGTVDCSTTQYRQPTNSSAFGVN